MANCHTPFKDWMSFQYLILLRFSWCEISPKSFLNVKILLLSSLTASGTFFSSFLSLPLSIFISITLPLLSASSCVMETPTWQKCQYFQGHRLLLWFHLHLIQIPLPALLLFVSLLFFHLYWPVSFFNYPFSKWVYPWGRRGQHSNTLAVYSWTNICTETNRWLT